MSEFTYDSPSVQSHLSILQEVISRMASNSAAAKTWCIALVSAILVVISDKEIPDLVWIALVPILLLSALDAYYLGLERVFRGQYNAFIDKLHRNEVGIADIYVVTPSEGSGATFKTTFRAMRSFSIWPFYSIQLLVLVAIRAFLLPQ